MSAARSDAEAPVTLDRATWALLKKRPRPGLVRLRGLGGSMRPLVVEDDEVLVEPAPASLRAGDVVVVDLGPGRPVALHRVLAAGDTILVKGDANPEPDGRFPPEAILGRARFLRSPGRPPRDLDSPRERALARLVALASPHSALVVRLLGPAWRLAKRLGIGR